MKAFVLTAFNMTGDDDRFLRRREQNFMSSCANRWRSEKINENFKSPSVMVSFGFLRWMYWTDWEEDPKESKRGRIERAWMDGSNRNMFLSSKTVLWPNGLSLDVPQGILYWVDAYYDRIEMVYLNSSERKVSMRSPPLWVHS